MQKNAEFENKEWLVQSINYNDIPNQDGKIFLKFNRSTRRLSGFGGCNNILGSYSISGSDLKIIPARSKSDCPDLMETEDQFMNLLEKTVEFREFSSSDKDYLRLITSDGSSIELRLKK
jgi:heat shock protein HslJ